MEIPYVDSVYPIVWMDAIHYKVTDERGCTVSRAIYNILGTNRGGIMYISKNGGVNFWHSILTKAFLKLFTLIPYIHINEEE